MGSFIDNCHIYGCTLKAVKSQLAAIIKADAYVAKSGGVWVTVYPDESESTSRIAQLLSNALKTGVLATYVHDDGFLTYDLFEDGVQVDEYNSKPDYFGEQHIGGEPKSKFDLNGTPARLAKYARNGVTEDGIAACLEGTKNQLFASKGLTNLAGLLGVDSSCVSTSKRYLMRGEGISDGHNPALVRAPETAEYLTKKLVRELDDFNFNTKAAEKLIERGANVHAIYNPAGYNLLMHCICPHICISAAELLVRRGADVNYKLPPLNGRGLWFDGYRVGFEGGTTALMMAAESIAHRHEMATQVVELLIAAGADVHAKTNSGETAVDYALRAGDDKRLKSILGRVHWTEEMSEMAKQESAKRVSMIKTAMGV